MSIGRPRTIILNGRKTSLRLESVMWEALGDIARHLGTTRNELLNRIDAERPRGQSLTSAIRVYVVHFYRSRAGLDLVSAPQPRKPA